MDKPKLKNVYAKNRKLILVLYSVFTIWHSFQYCMLIQNTVHRNLYFQLIKYFDQ